jgi:hypothetical protein
MRMIYLNRPFERGDPSRIAFETLDLFLKVVLCFMMMVVDSDPSYALSKDSASQIFKTARAIKFVLTASCILRRSPSVTVSRSITANALAVPSKYSRYR